MNEEDFMLIVADCQQDQEVMENSFEVLTSAQVHEMMEKEVGKVKNVIDVSEMLEILKH